MKNHTKGQIILAVGLPGSGKSTYFRQRRIHPLSSDALRSWLLDDDTDQTQQYRIFSALRHLLRMRLLAGRQRNYVDATNLTPNERRPYFELAKRHGYEMRAIYFDVPLGTCLERNRRRARKVPRDVMERMARKLVPPTKQEGFARITVLRPGKRIQGS